MMIIVTDSGFVADEGPSQKAAGAYREVTLSELADGLPGDSLGLIGLVLPNDADAHAVVPFFGTIDSIIVTFPSFADGRGFSLARQLRRLGYRGRLVAQGHVIADQYAHARRCGFDAVAIDAATAARQPEEQWTAQVARINVTYQNRLHQTAEVA